MRLVAEHGTAPGIPVSHQQSAESTFVGCTVVPKDLAHHQGSVTDSSSMAAGCARRSHTDAKLQRYSSS